MHNDLISRDDLTNARPEFMNEKVVRDTKYRTSKDRIYAKAWNACNNYWLNTIKDAPTIEERPKGAWIGHGSVGLRECPFCHKDSSSLANFCQYCGADNRKEKNNE